MKVQIAILSALCIVGCGERQADVTERSQGTESNEDSLGACISRVHQRLSAIKGRHPQLSAIDSATLSPTSLVYDKGTVSWPEGKMGGPRFTVPSGCHLHVSLAHPIPQERAIGAMDQGRYYPEAQLQVELLFLCAGDDADTFRKALRSIVFEETDALAEALQKVEKESQQEL